MKPSWAVTKLMLAEGRRPVAGVEVGAAGEAVGELGQRAARRRARSRAPVAVLAVPLRPQRREVAHLVAALADVPGLGDQLDLAEHRVLLDEVEEGRQAVDLVQLAGQRGGQVEAEAVDVHLEHPVAQAVHDQLQHVRVPHVQACCRCRCSPCSSAGRRASAGSRRRCRCPLKREHRPAGGCPRRCGCRPRRGSPRCRPGAGSSPSA